MHVKIKDLFWLIMTLILVKEEEEEENLFILLWTYTFIILAGQIYLADHKSIQIGDVRFP